MSSRTKPLHCFLLLYVLAVLPTGCRNLASDSSKQAENGGAGVYAAAGVMTTEQYTALRSLGKNMERRRTISAEELDWLIHLTSTVKTNDQSAVASNYDEVLSTLAIVTDYPVDEKDKIFTFVEKVINTPDSVGAVQHHALLVLKNLKDQRAKPIIQPFLQSTHPKVRQAAVEALNALG